MKIPILILFLFAVTMFSCIKEWTCRCETRTVDTSGGNYQINIEESEFSVWGVKGQVHNRCEAKTEVFNRATSEGMLCGIK